MKKSSPKTCKNLFATLRKLQQHFQQLQQKVDNSGSLNANHALQDFLDESQMLAEQVRLLDKQFAPVEVRNLLRDFGEQYENAKVLALEFSPKVKIPSKAVVMKEIWNLGIEKLLMIARFERPLLLFTPPTSMARKKMVLDSEQSYPGQEPTGFADGVSHEIWENPFDKLTLSIVEAVPNLPPISDEVWEGENRHIMNLEDHYIYCRNWLKAQGMRMITAHEYALLMRQSLKNYENAELDPNCQNPQKEIVDFFVHQAQMNGSFQQPKNRVCSLLYQPDLSFGEMEVLPFGNYFFNFVNRVNFSYYELADDSADRDEIQYLRLRKAFHVANF